MNRAAFKAWTARLKRGLGPWLAVGGGAALAGVSIAAPVSGEGPVPHATGLALKKAPDGLPSVPPLLGTLVEVHGGESLPLDATTPTLPRFDALLADRATGEVHALDPHLLGLLKSLAASHLPARIELVSGYRSWKLNEALRKKGHHVASHSQHSLGHAVDFRLFPEGADEALDPRDVEREIRALGWEGGVGVYTGKDDWFVHADVGRNRGWQG